MMRVHGRQRRHPRRRLHVSVTLMLATTAPTGPPPREETFAEQLAHRLGTTHPEVLEALTLEPANFRCERLAELCADLTDLVVAYDDRLMGESTIRHGGLANA